MHSPGWSMVGPAQSTLWYCWASHQSPRTPRIPLFNQSRTREEVEVERLYYFHFTNFQPLMWEVASEDSEFKQLSDIQGAVEI